jgi:hypothetical protein
MKRFIIYISILFLGLAYVTNAQTTVSLPDTVVTVGPTTLNIPIKVQNFNNVGAISLTISYDPSVLTFQGIENGAAASLSVNEASTGIISIGWFSDGSKPFSVPSDGKLTDLKFNYKSGNSALTFVTANGKSEIASFSGSILATNFVSGSISSPVKVSLDHIKASVGDTVSVPIRALNLQNVGSISLSINYDSSVLDFVGVKNDSVGFSQVNAAGGKVNLAWFASNNTPLNKLNNVLTELRFKLKGESSALSFFTFNGATEIADIDAKIINVTFVNGSVSTDRNVSLPTIQANPNTNVTFPLTVTNLSVGSANIDLSYDPAVLTFVKINNIAGDGAAANVVSPGVLRIAYFDADPAVATGKLFDLEFSYKNGSSALSFIQANTSFTDALGAVYSSFDYVNGAVSQISAQAPVFTAVMPNVSVNEGDTLKFNYKATDVNNDTLTFALSAPAPAGAAINASTGLFTWVPTFEQAGTYNVVVSVSDGSNKTVDTAVVTVVNVNRNPVFVNTPGATTVVRYPEPGKLTFKYTATDADGDTLTYSLIGASSKATITADGEFTYVANDTLAIETIRVKVADKFGGADTAVTVISSLSAVILPGTLPTAYALNQNFPNPFNPSTAIRFQLPKESYVTLKVYNLLGEQVSSIVSEYLPAGYHEYKFDASSLATGVYIYRIQAGDFISTKKMTLIK